MSQVLWDALCTYHLSANFEGRGSILQKKKLRLVAGRRLGGGCSSLCVRVGIWPRVCLTRSRGIIALIQQPLLLTASRHSSSRWTWGQSETTGGNFLACDTCLTDGRALPCAAWSHQGCPVTRCFPLVIAAHSYLRVGQGDT